jgi:hypothetical protein
MRNMLAFTHYIETNDQIHCETPEITSLTLQQPVVSLTMSKAAQAARMHTYVVIGSSVDPSVSCVVADWSLGNTAGPL